MVTYGFISSAMVTRLRMLSEIEKRVLRRCLESIPDQFQRMMFLCLACSPNDAIYELVNELDDESIGVVLAEEAEVVKKQKL